MTTINDPLRFAYWVPNVSGGLVVSDIEQRTDWGFEYNRDLARTAERVGFDYALTQVRYLASYGADHQHESTSLSLALALATDRLKVIAAVHPGLWQPAVLAKWIASADHLTGGRMAINVVSGWFKGEFTAMGEPWLEHDERYRRASEFIEMVRTIWTEDVATYVGDFYRAKEYSLRPKPLQEPTPEIFMGGNSTAARAMGSRLADWYLMNGNTVEGVTEQVDDVGTTARARDHDVSFALNAFVVNRDTEDAARRQVDDIIARADVDAVEGFRQSVQQAGRSTSDHRGMWSDSDFSDLVQYNDGFKTGLIGRPEQIAERIMTYKAAGVGLLLCGFLHMQEELERFGTEVIPLVRQMESQEAAA